jgi:hypothetical protein
VPILVEMRASLQHTEQSQCAAGGLKNQNNNRHSRR